jgi:pantetheine-phosphate adenylyltransferase
VKRALYAGSFDPVTNGHLDVLGRAAHVFDEVVIAVACNSEKRGLFTPDERVELLRDAVAVFPNVRVMQFTGLLVEFARREDACAIIRGLRAVSDFEFEFQMALMNRRLAPSLETMFLMPKEEYSYVSSRLVKEVASLGGDVTAFVPPGVARALAGKFSKEAARKAD